MRWALLLLLLAVLVAVAIPNFVKARVTTSKNSCLFHRMWIEEAKQKWGEENRAPATAEPTPLEIIPYLDKVTPKWDGRPNTRPPSQGGLPGCPMDTNVTYVLGKLYERVRCPLAETTPGDYHHWNEATYQLNYKRRR